MSSNLFLGSSYELKLASMLSLEGIVIATPLVDVGVDLIATCPKFNKFTPIQVKKKSFENNIFFNGKEVEKYSGKNIYIAYYLEGTSWFMPFDTFLDNAPKTKRKDQARILEIGKANKYFSEYKDEAGFKKMIQYILGDSIQSLPK